MACNEETVRQGLLQKNTRWMIHFPFSHTYSVAVAQEFPGESSVSPLFYYPGARFDGGKDGILLTMQPRRYRKWLGLFAFGELHEEGFTGVFSCPHEDQLCVVARGRGYVVDVENPATWEAIPTEPILDVRAMTDPPLLLFFDFNGIAALSREGVAWMTEVSLEGIEGVRVSPGEITGWGWRKSFDQHERFTVEATTGKVTWGRITRQSDSNSS